MKKLFLIFVLFAVVLGTNTVNSQIKVREKADGTMPTTEEVVVGVLKHALKEKITHLYKDKNSTITYLDIDLRGVKKVGEYTEYGSWEGYGAITIETKNSNEPILISLYVRSCIDLLDWEVKSNIARYEHIKVMEEFL